ncbi:MAG: peptidylprolyl isomerase [Oscillospiraceae bacterium]|nr:peptidylprolyl isomerase [Oscillospiraceae bacterium]MBQ3193359.1 peptidylprolyl isomerase [Oscillospiraceae bacterium]
MDHAEKKATPGKIALAVAAVVLLAAVLIGIVMSGFGNEQAAQPAAETVETQTQATIPADGNPEDETAKGSYTASDEAVRAAADTVVATMGDYTLTNGQLQVYYWMEVQSFLSSYGSYAAYFGLDTTQPLETQVCTMAENGESWQQFFLAGALNTWRSHQSLAAEAEKAGFEIQPELQAELENIPAMMEQNAMMYGMESVEQLLKYNVGGGASMDDYVDFMELYYKGYSYYSQMVEANVPTDAEIEAYFTENEAAYLESGLAREDKYVDVRHVLIMPEGADSSNIRTETFEEAAWETSRVKAEELLAQWEQGDKSEESFAQLAKDHSQDGSAADGGLFTDVTKGQMVEAFENWCFDEARQAGDYGLVETEFGYHLMFFVGSRPVYPDYVKSDLQNTFANDLVNNAVSKYTVEADFEKMLIAAVDMTGGAGDAEEAPVAEEKPALSNENKVVIVLAGVSIAALVAAAFVLNKKEHE